MDFTNVQILKDIQSETFGKIQVVQSQGKIFILKQLNTNNLRIFNIFSQTETYQKLQNSDLF